MADSDWKTFFLIAVLVAVVVALFLWGVPPLLLEQEMGHLDKPDAYRLADLKDAYRRTLAQILGGLALLYGLYLTYRRIVATEDNVRVAEEGQVTERFTRAIEQLGHEEMAIRLGGIYALERLAKDSEKDHGPIMEILTAYVRERATKQGQYAKEATAKPTTDIQAALTVIGRRETSGNNRGTDRLDLSNTRLTGAMLNRANLSGAQLNEADLSRAVLLEADLSSAMLNEADLSGAVLLKADLSSAWLQQAKLIEAELYEANLDMAKLIGADLHEANLGRANLIDASLSNAKNLTAEQVQGAKNWRSSYLPGYLEYLLTDPPS